MKNVAIVGGGKEGLALLPLLKKVEDVRVALIADRNKSALLFKLSELGYKISQDLNIKVTSDLNAVKDNKDIDLIIDASEDDETHSILHSFHLENVEIISPLSARLIWEHTGEGGEERKAFARSDKAGILSSLREIVEAVNLTNDKGELLSMVLRVALSSSGADRGSIMLLEKEEGPLRIEVFEGVDAGIAKAFRGKPGEGIAGKVAKSGKPLLLSGHVDDSRLDKLRGWEEVTSALSVPLLAEKKTIGVLNISTNKSDEAFGEKDLKFLTELASLGARIILRSQEIEEMRDNSDRFSLWKKVSNLMNAAIPLEKRLWQVSKTISAYAGGECEIYTLERDAKELYLRASSSASFSPSTYYKVSVGEGIEGIAAQAGRETVVRGESPDGKNILVRACPLVSGDEMQGVMKMLYYGEDEAYGDGGAPLEELISLIAEEIKDSLKEERITLKATKISAINEAGINLISTADIKELTRLAVSSAAMILGADAGVIRLLDEKSSHFTIMAAHGVDDKDSRISLFKLDKELASEAIKKGETVIKPDLRKGAYGGKRDIPLSGLCHPVIIEEKVIGTISLYDKILEGAFEPVPFNKEDMEIIGRFTTYAEKAISNILDLQESKKLISLDELTSLPNAESMERRLQSELERSKRHKRAFTFAFMEVANFNSYIKVYGHDGGDRLVKDIAHNLREGLRAFDVIGRFWGSRFALILPESEEKGADIIKRLMAALESSKLDPEGLLAPQKVKVACGYVNYRGGDIESDDLIKGAAEDLEEKRRAVLER